MNQPTSTGMSGSAKPTHYALSVAVLACAVLLAAPSAEARPHKKAAVKKPQLARIQPQVSQQAQALDALITHLQINEAGSKSKNRSETFIDNALDAKTDAIMAASNNLSLPSTAPNSPTKSSFLDSVADRTNHLISQAFNYVGVRYKYGGNSEESGFDCSSYVGQVFRDAFGLILPRRAAEISHVGASVNKEELKPGDLVFFNTLRTAFSHVGIYLGNNQFIHAPSSGGQIRVENMDLPYWQSRYSGARRVDDNPNEVGLAAKARF